MRSFTCFASVVGMLATVVNASLNPIVVKGNAFFDSVTGKRFYIRGVDYQVLCSEFVEGLLTWVSLVDLLL